MVEQVLQRRGRAERGLCAHYHPDKSVPTGNSVVTPSDVAEPCVWMPRWERGRGLARGFPVHAMGAQTARRWLVGCVPKSRLPRWLGLTRAPCSFLSHPDDRQEGAGEAPPIPSDWC